jgi:hypothetical protein
MNRGVKGLLKELEKSPGQGFHGTYLARIVEGRFEHEGKI